MTAGKARRRSPRSDGKASELREAPDAALGAEVADAELAGGGGPEAAAMQQRRGAWRSAAVLAAVASSALRGSAQLTCDADNSSGSSGAVSLWQRVAGDAQPPQQPRQLSVTRAASRNFPQVCCAPLFCLVCHLHEPVAEPP